MSSFTRYFDGRLEFRESGGAEGGTAEGQLDSVACRAIINAFVFSGQRGCSVAGVVVLERAIS